MRKANGGAFFHYWQLRLTKKAPAPPWGFSRQTPVLGNNFIPPREMRGHNPWGSFDTVSILLCSKDSFNTLEMQT